MKSVSGQSIVEEAVRLADINWIKDKSAPIAAKYGLRRMYLDVPLLKAKIEEILDKV